MEAVAYSNFRKRLKSFFKKVNADSEPLIVTNKEPKDNVVIMSKNDYDAIMETININSNKYLMAKLARGDKQFKAGEFHQHRLIEEGNNDQELVR